jgi:hypothetical protein
MQGGIISTALELIKEKEKQADRASARLHDGMKTQMELTANQGSWTGDHSTSQSKPVTSPTTVVVDKKEETTKAPASIPSGESDDDDKKDDIANMGIINLAQGASK